jgi:hypothetical protein
VFRGLCLFVVVQTVSFWSSINFDYLWTKLKQVRFCGKAQKAGGGKEMDCVKEACANKIQMFAPNSLDVFEVSEQWSFFSE